MTYACYWTHHGHLGFRFLKICAQALQRNNIRFVPVSAGNAIEQVAVPEYSEEVHERTIVLSKTLCTSVLSFLFSSSEELCIDIERQFRDELPCAYPALFQTCPVILRIRTVLLAKDSDGLIKSYKQQDIPISTWVLECQATVSSITTHLKSLKALLAKCSTVPDHESCMGLRYSIIANSTFLAEFYDILGSGSSTPKSLLSSEAVDFQAKCRHTIADIVQTARGINGDYYSYFDTYLKICFERVISLLRRTKPLNSGAATSSPVPELYDSHESCANSAPPDANFHDASVRFLSGCLDKLYDTVDFNPPGPGSVYEKLTALNRSRGRF